MLNSKVSMLEIFCQCISSGSIYSVNTQLRKISDISYDFSLCVSRPLQKQQFASFNWFDFKIDDKQTKYTYKMRGIDLKKESIET